MNKIVSLLRECEETHYSCKDTSQPHLLPSRVLDVGGDIVRVIETQSLIKDRYVTLSHCWGPATTKFLTATLENLADLRKEIPLEDLTPVFQDAVKLTIHVGIRYLWVDALCIIQDSKEDWVVESGNMASIYQHATLTIASSCSPDSNTHFLRPRRSEDKIDIPFTSPLRKKSCTISLRHMVNYDDIIAAHLQEPLQSRAWCFQERILSRRTIFFDSQQFLWECHAGCIPECSAVIVEYMAQDTLPDQSPLFSYEKIPNEASSPTTPQSSFATPQDAWVSLADKWYSMLDEFSRRHLTYQDDTLPALSGVAKYLERVTGDTYLVGIWRADFHRGLVWNMCNTGLKSRNRYAPSWSWASLMSNISFLNPDETSFPFSRKVDLHDAVLLAADIHPLYGDFTTGPLSSGVLCIRGWVRYVTIEYHGGMPKYFDKFGEEEPVDGLHVTKLTSDDDYVFQCNEEDRGAGLDTILKRSLTALLISQWEFCFTTGGEEKLVGLLLNRKLSSGPYVRVGLFTIRLLRHNFSDTWGDWREETVEIS